MKFKDRKAMDNILTDELNVHRLRRHIATCERGEIILVYHNDLGFKSDKYPHDTYTWEVGVDTFKASDKAVEAVLG